MGKNKKIVGYPVTNICPYCEHEVVLVHNKEVYGKDYGCGNMYYCRNCKASVGTHPGTDIPLGRLANQRLKNLKKLAHAYFDPNWKSRKKYRWQCYTQLAFKLDIPVEECHFGWFDEPMLMKSIDILKKGLF